MAASSCVIVHVHVCVAASHWCLEDPGLIPGLSSVCLLFFVKLHVCALEIIFYLTYTLLLSIVYCLSLMFCVQEIDLKAGGGFSVTIGEMCRMMLSKLDWFGTLFPRLPVHVQKDLEEKLRAVKKTMR